VPIFPKNKYRIRNRKLSNKSSEISHRDSMSLVFACLAASVLSLSLTLLSNCRAAFADSEYLDLTYTKKRYEQSGTDSRSGIDASTCGGGTDIWYAVIPAKYKMHYAYGNNKVYPTKQLPSASAANHGATIAINTQFLGYPIVNGSLYDGSESKKVTGYEFKVSENASSSVDDHDRLKIEAVSSEDDYEGISFKDINLGFTYYGNAAHEASTLSNGAVVSMALFSQLVMNGTEIDVSSDNTTAAKYIINRDGKNDMLKRNPRTWIAYDSSGTQYVAVAAGRTVNGEANDCGLTFDEMISATKKYMTSSIKTMYNLDGGGSSNFWYKGSKLNPNIDTDNLEERATRGIFYWKVETQTVSFANTSVTKTYGDAVFTNKATTTGDGAITYSSSNTNVATVDSSTGQVTIKGAGTATITAKAAATDTHNSGSAAYTLTVNDITYTITYDANGGSVAPRAQTFKASDNKVTLSTTPAVRDYYTFLGWSTSKTATTASYGAGESYSFSGDTTLYAVWGAANTNPKTLDTAAKSVGSVGVAVLLGSGLMYILKRRR